MSTVLAKPLKVYFFNSDQVGPSPAQSKKTITWPGELFRAILTVRLTYGGGAWPLQKVVLNGHEYYPSDPNKRVGDDFNYMMFDVREAIRNGDNTLTVHYGYPFSAHFGARTTLTAILEVGARLPNTPLDLPVSDIPSAELTAENLDKKLANATVPTIAILTIIAVIAIALAIIISKVGLFAKGGQLFA